MDSGTGNDWYWLFGAWLALNVAVFLVIWKFTTPIKRRPSKPSAPSAAGGRTPRRGKTSRRGSSGKKSSRTSDN